MLRVLVGIHLLLCFFIGVGCGGRLSGGVRVVIGVGGCLGGNRRVVDGVGITLVFNKGSNRRRISLLSATSVYGRVGESGCGIFAVKVAGRKE